MPMFRVIELRQLVGATTMAKGLSSHQIIKNAAKEEILVIVTLEDDADVDSGNDDRYTRATPIMMQMMMLSISSMGDSATCTNTVLAIGYW